MKYPIEITREDLANYGIDLQTGENAEVENNRFLSVVHRSFYEMILYRSHRGLRERIVEMYKEKLEGQIKAILLDIAACIDQDGDFNALWSGKTRGDGGVYNFADLQDRILSSIPPLTWQSIFSLEPNVMFSGGDI